MKVSDAIKKADELRPNVISPEQKAEWLYELEGDFAEMMAVDFPENVWETNPDAETLIPYPKDECYVLYLCAKIDNALEETALYQNDYFQANAAVAEARAWYRRHNRPAKHYGVKI